MDRRGPRQVDAKGYVTQVEDLYMVSTNSSVSCVVRGL